MLQTGCMDIYGKSLGSVFVDKYPDRCPICFSGISPNHFANVDILNRVDKAKNPHRLTMIFACPKDDCRNLFLSYYVPRAHVQHGQAYYFDSSLPAKRQTRGFSTHIKNVSEEFCQTYAQAEVAEQEGLDKVCGPAYGRALEILIKDYLITKKPEEEEAIKAEHKLGKLIADKVEDGRIRAIATRAAWLRNDEIHYQRKWVDKDVQDLKGTIELVVHWIEAEMLTQELIISMPAN